MRSPWERGPVQWEWRGGLPKGKLTSSPHRRTHSWGQERTLFRDRKQRQHADREHDHPGLPLSSEKAHLPPPHQGTLGLWVTVQSGFLHHVANWVNQSPSLGLSFLPMKWMGSQATSKQDKWVTMDHIHSLVKDPEKATESTQADGQGLLLSSFSHSCLEQAMLPTDGFRTRVYSWFLLVD